MDNDRKKELKQQYAERKPDMGIVCWQCGDNMWIDPSKDIKATYNSTSFQLKLGSWRNREMQDAYNKQGEEAFEWKVLAKLDYDDPTEDHTDDLQILLMEIQEKYPNAKLMSPNRKGNR
ncbi:MAG: GIY-YIG nuclease family protein [Acutalibacteraceae bacterium]|nr:GIY-YIG nuclease family protein [Acutalibacteraceae bacterium]